MLIWLVRHPFIYRRRPALKSSDAIYADESKIFIPSPLDGAVSCQQTRVGDLVASFLFGEALGGIFLMQVSIDPGDLLGIVTVRMLVIQ